MGCVDWINVAQDRVKVVGTCKCSYEPSGSIKCGEFFLLAENRLASQEGLCFVELVSK